MSAPLWTPKFASYKEALESADTFLTVESLALAMAEIPDEIRDKLAEGPLAYRWSCGVCEAFGKEFYGTGVVDDSDPRWLVWIYHETPKARMTRLDEQHYGPLANELYERCLATYRAAGWTGDAGEANA